MSSNNQLKYQILKSKLIMGEGEIQDIKRRIMNKKFQLFSSRDETFELSLRFNSPSIITKIHLRFIKTHSYELRLMNAHQKVLDTFVQIIKGQQKVITLTPLTNQPVSLVHLKIQNDLLDMKRLGIMYVVFEGFSDETVKKANHNKEKKELFKDLHQTQKNIRKTPKSIQSKEIFQNRQKLKTTPQKLEKLLDFSQFDAQFTKFSAEKDKTKQKSEPKARKKVKHNEDVLETTDKKQISKNTSNSKRKQKQDTQLAIALSQSQNQMQEQKEYMRMQIQQMGIQQVEQQKSLPSALQNYADQIFSQPQQRTYQTVKFQDEYISLFSDLSPKWIEAQRKAEQQSNVRHEQRLSKYIRLKSLIGTEIYIDGFPEWKVDELKHQAKDLGCKILSELKNHCIAIVSKGVCEKQVKKHKEWNEVKYLNPEYLEDCIKNQSKLNPKDYYIRI